MYSVDPRTKLLSVTVLTIAVFFLDKILIFVSLIILLFLFRFAMLKKFNIRFALKFRLITSILLLSAFIVLIQTFLGGGFFLGLIIICRVISLMLIFPILTDTTPPYRLSAALNVMGFPYSIAFVITTAFNQIPHFIEEARFIMDAQKLRGLSAFEKSVWNPLNLVKKINAYAGICLPLVLGAMRKAQVTSVAMDSRAFGVNKTRSWVEKPKMKKKDYLLIFGCVIFVVLLLLFNNADYIF